MAAYEYDGFFAAMDTFKDKQQLDDLYEGGRPPWEVWRAANEKPQKTNAETDRVAFDRDRFLTERRTARRSRVKMQVDDRVVR